MKHEKGRWRVIRNCCTSGMCATCRGFEIRPRRILQGDHYSKAYAEYIAGRWHTYEAVARPMLGTVTRKAKA
jgi:hypothetical protein